MGCICSKETQSNEYVGDNKYNHGEKEDNVKAETNAAAWLISSQQPSQKSGSDDEKNKMTLAVVEKFKNTPSQIQRGLSLDAQARGGQGHQQRFSRLVSVTGGERGGQIVSGWPSWLVSIAGEAISGWIPSKADSYERLEKIDQGAYSSVYKARDVETNRIVALKKVRFGNMDPESIRFMVKEIIILRRLDHSNVMKLEGIITSRVSGSLYLIFKYMEHDLAGFAATPGIKLTEAQIKCYMQQLLNGLDHCHSRGILHRDIKGANILIDNNGNLKIADFGLATFSHADEKRPMASRVVTLWYRPLELLLGCTDYGAAVDLWSAGCILTELFAGKPIVPGRTEVLVALPIGCAFEFS
ncbi:Cyclin-dependent kinase C-2 [Hibiscus syriacus]|uniref:Cyclin-dependent kinase C-2 n=1 Tax=Hibiscus syriacus TaxID=106335 RepID=A0A6A2Y6E4_HIBSY|nr:Cyclin-dependent kinase C-2 [Hibiscus syriacus]